MWTLNRILDRSEHCFILVYLVHHFTQKSPQLSCRRVLMSANVLIKRTEGDTTTPIHWHELNISYIPTEHWRNENSWKDIISRLWLQRLDPGVMRERECLQYVMLATWWKHHSFFKNFKEGKNVCEKCTLIHDLIYLCIGLIYLSSNDHILFLISWTTFYTAGLVVYYTGDAGRPLMDIFIILRMSRSIMNICLTQGIS